ncbi:MAG: discoidin domain-containing protein [Treponema sp.]|nr:discoidin domain-containing protein [Treponema sp.]
MFGKKCLISLFIVSLLFVCLSGCPGSPEGSPPAGGTVPSAHTGVLIKMTAHNAAYADIANNSGMSGNGERIHLHSNNTAHMYAGQQQDFIFDIGHIDQLGEMHVWNYNAAAGAHGLQRVIVSFSNDNENYTELDVFTLARADGNDRLEATNLSNGMVINFRGRSARYVKITPQTNYGGGQWGLSEVKLYRYRNAVYRGAYLQGSPVYRLADPPEANYYNLANGAGLSHPTNPQARHDNNPAHMFFTMGSNSSFEIDLQGRYPVQSIVIWNYNAPGLTARGMQSVTISTSDDLTNWTTRVTNAAIAAGTGQNGMGPSATIPVNFTARYVRISGSSIGAALTGLSAVRFYAGDGWYAEYLPDWTALFSNYNGWIGADGIYSTKLDANNTIFIFSDTWTGTVNPVTALRTERTMINNTRGILSGNVPLATKMTFSAASRNDTSNVITPVNQPGRWYWLGDVVVIGNKLYIYTVTVASGGGGGAFNFSQVGVDLVRFDIVNGTVNQSSLTRFRDENRRLADSSAGTSDPNPRWYLGAALFENTAEHGALKPDGYIYVYGYLDGHGAGDRRLITARVKPEDIEDFTKYEYLWNNDTWRVGEPWGASLTNPKSLGVGSTEFSIHEVKSGPNTGKFMSIMMPYFQDMRIMAAYADTPAGVFSAMEPVFFATDPPITLPNDGTMYVYNGKAHPAISTNNELIISYNTNCMGGLEGQGDIYRPRFIRYAQVPLSASRAAGEVY